MTKVIKKCRDIAKKENITLRRSFRRELPNLLRKRVKTKKFVKRVRTIAGVLIRELERKLSKKSLANYKSQLDIFRKIHKQQRADKNKIYSLHEPKNLHLKDRKNSSKLKDNQFFRDD